MCGILLLVGISPSIAQECLDTLKPRGPDAQILKSYQDSEEVLIGFTRLAINDLSENGMQPFEHEKLLTHNGRIFSHQVIAVTNGEIYNHESFDIGERKSTSDCEVILPLYYKYGFETMLTKLDGEFATVIYDRFINTIYAGRDRHGIRPLFIGIGNGGYGFASEMKALQCFSFIKPVEPGKFYSIDMSNSEPLFRSSWYWFEYIYRPITDPSHDEMREFLIKAVEKRIHGTDRPFGFLLSGGFDSSIIVAIAVSLIGPDKVICFSVGVPDSSDVIAAKKVTVHFGIKNHHLVPFMIEDGIKSLPSVVKKLESWDTTTIRASTPMDALGEFISTKTNIKVVFSGELSDELFGSYRYNIDAPNVKEFDENRRRRLMDVYMYDALRVDRILASWGLEARVSFSDKDLVDYVMGISGEHFMFNKDKMEKLFIRDAFKGYLPDEILYRRKEAFSDAVSSTEINWARSIQEHVKDMELVDPGFTPKPLTKEALWYRLMFEKYYPGHGKVIGEYWMPRFQKTEVTDPSATVLENY